MSHDHHYAVTVDWTGNLGTGTADYRTYDRRHEIAAEGKPPIPGSSDPAFRGDPARWNPEDLLVASLSACHMLWYLHLCAVSGIVVTAYRDRAVGTMAEGEDGGGRFASVTLVPEIVVQPGADLEKARALHHEAHAKCFIASSVNFPVGCAPEIRVEEPAAPD
ncbi:MAG: peroxiredoxin [Alphaproteobacteria bacterium]|nr:MAG: peroxiredoxin [Alphaproteobacteria bacterium]